MNHPIMFSTYQYYIPLEYALLEEGWDTGIPHFRTRYSDPLADVDVDVDYEFQLIVKKASKLSASQRREVVRRYHNKPVPDRARN